MKKYSNGSFVDAALRVYGSEADTITSFPATIYADGENASAVIYGNMEQSGTPTPTNPIQPSECGDLETEGTKAGQYKIPISSANTTTPVYLGEVETTRKVKKYIFTGTENWTKGLYPKPGSYQFSVLKSTYFPDAKSNITSGNSFCSHFINQEIAGGIAWGSLFSVYMLTSDLPENASADDFKAFLAAQYAAGTPVTTWYPLAEPTTGIVNEPIRKIGDYEDSVGAAAIPTTAGSQSFTIDTTLKPSSVSLTYTGWHTHADKQYSGGAWT